MPLSQDTLRFIREHRRDDVRSLALQARRYTLQQTPAAITQISAGRLPKRKYPHGRRTTTSSTPPTSHWSNAPPKQRHSIKRRS